MQFYQISKLMGLMLILLLFIMFIPCMGEDLKLDLLGFYMYMVVLRGLVAIFS